MNQELLIGLVLAMIGVASIGYLLYHLVLSRREANIRTLMGGNLGGSGFAARTRRKLEDDPDGVEFERLKKETSKKLKKKKVVTLEERFFQAGIFTEGGKREYHRMRVLLPMVLTPMAGLIAHFFVGKPMITLLFSGMGLWFGFLIPSSILNRRKDRRDEDIMFYLPLVIEQISIGVSSSLETGPCVQRVVQMADERDSHNVVTELLRHTQYYVKSGVSFEEALMEVGKLSGHTELKHAFLALSQVARHGGEISRQLQELASSVSMQREAHIEGQIKKLELKATAPLAMVFFGFFIMILCGFAIRMLGVFG